MSKVKASEFFDAQNECVILLESLQLTAEYASKLLGFVAVRREDDKDNIISLQPCSHEHFENLQKFAKQLSSYSDRFNNKLNMFKNVVDNVDE